jgi:hypothetical protein
MISLRVNLTFLFLISVCLSIADEMVYTHSTNIYGLVKLFLLKFSVGLIVLEVRIAEQR